MAAQEGDDRGAAPGTDAQRVRRVIVIAGLLILAVLVIVLTVEAEESNSRRGSLQHHGVLVDVTVTSCLGESAGMGDHVNGYRCQGSFTLDGRSYTDEIAGTSAKYAIGKVVTAVVDSADRSTLSTTASVSSTPPAWKAYIGAAICLLLLLISLVSVGWFRRRAKSRRGTSTRSDLPRPEA
jgi:hypothetical protein